jgi:protein TonB
VAPSLDYSQPILHLKLKRMNVTTLNTRIRAVIAAIAVTTLAAACNDNENTANNSTVTDSSGTTATVVTTDTGALAANPSATPATTGAGGTTPSKRKGRVTASIKADDATVKMEMDKTGYYNRTEVTPAYPGGQTSLEDYITNHIEYPQDAIDNNTEGTVYVQFGVDENGNVTNVTTTGSKLGNGLEDEAIRVVSSMPKWTPGQVKGKKVKVWRTLPITYKLES